MSSLSELFRVSLSCDLAFPTILICPDIIIPRGIENKTAIGMKVLARAPASNAEPARYGVEAHTTEAPRKVREAQREFIRARSNLLGREAIAKCAHHAPNTTVCGHEYDPPRSVNGRC